MKARDFSYTRAATVKHAIDLLVEHGSDARVIAGGQSLGPLLNLRLASPKMLVDISRLPELTGVEKRNDSFWIGAAVRHADIEDGVAREATPGILDRVAGGIAYRAVRNRGTIGGSLAHADPCGDWLPVLIALGAITFVRGSKAEREIAMSGLAQDVMTTCLAPDEILVGITIPRLSTVAKWGHFKFCRKPGEFAEIIATVVVDRQQHRSAVVLSIPSQLPLQLKMTAQLISNLDRLTADTEATVRDAVLAELELQDLNAASDPYLHQLAPVAVKRALQEAFPS